MDKRIWRNYDFVLLIAALLLLAYGVAMIHSASHTLGAVKDSALRQAIFAVVGIVVGQPPLGQRS